MKKIFVGIALISLALTACDNNRDRNHGSLGDKEELYAGIMPAADAEGILYTLKLDYDDDHNYTDGDFQLVETALIGDTVSAMNLRTGVTSLTEGDFRIETSTAEGETTSYMRLVPDVKESLGAASTSTLYFIVNPDKSLTMVNSDLTKAANDSLNYTLTLKN